MTKNSIFKKLKNLFILQRQEKIIWKKVFLLIFLILSCLLFFYYSLSFLLVSRDDLCLERLRLSFLENPACRENCAAARIEDRKCLAEALKNKSKIEKKMETYIYNEEMQVDFRIFLIGIFRNVYGSDNPPSSLLNYLSLKSGDKSLQAAILRFFDFSRLGGNKDNPLDYYFNILKDENSSELRLEAAVKIASYKGGEEFFSLQQLALIDSIIMDKNTDKYLRQSLVLLLSDYLAILPEETNSLLQKIYNSNFYGDNISRVFAADILGLPLPEISQAEWDAYYQR